MQKRRGLNGQLNEQAIRGDGDVSKRLAAERRGSVSIAEKLIPDSKAGKPVSEMRRLDPQKKSEKSRTNGGKEG